MMPKEGAAVTDGPIQWVSLSTPPRILPERVIPVCKFFGKWAQTSEITSLLFKGELRSEPFELVGVFEAAATQGQAAVVYGQIVFAYVQFGILKNKLKRRRLLLESVFTEADFFFNEAMACDYAACTAAVLERKQISFVFDHEHYRSVIVGVREGALTAIEIVDVSYTRTAYDKFLIISPKEFVAEFFQGGKFRGNESEIGYEVDIIKRFDDVSKRLVDTNGEVMVMKFDKKISQTNGK